MDHMLPNLLQSIANCLLFLTLKLRGKTIFTNRNGWLAVPKGELSLPLDLLVTLKRQTLLETLRLF